MTFCYNSSNRLRHKGSAPNLLPHRAARGDFKNPATHPPCLKKESTSFLGYQGSRILPQLPGQCSCLLPRAPCSLWPQASVWSAPVPAPYPPVLSPITRQERLPCTPARANSSRSNLHSTETAGLLLRCFLDRSDLSGER